MIELLGAALMLGAAFIAAWAISAIVVEFADVMGLCWTGPKREARRHAQDREIRAAAATPYRPAYRQRRRAAP